MTNAERWINRFLKQYPEYESIRYKLTMNIYADIMIEEGKKNKIIAISDCSHSLANMKIYEEPRKWTLNDK